jgi:hypothetical protein
MHFQNYQARFISTLIFSILLHTLFILYAPEFLKIYTLPVLKEKIFEIQRIDITEKREVKVKEKKIPAKKKVMTKVAKEGSLHIPSSVEKVIDGKIKEIKLGEKFTPPPPLISLPEVTKAPSLIESPVTFKKYIPPESIEKFEPEGSALIGNMFGKKKDLPLPMIKAESKFLIKQAVVDDSFRAGKKEIIGKEPELKIREKNLKLGLKGEIINRKVTSQPKLPSAKIDVTTMVVLDFEVLPDGTVVKIRPQKRVDVTLERISIDYLKKWKFSNLPLDAAQKSQKGSLVVKFELE